MNNNIDQFYIDYIKAIENPDKIGWNGKIWTAPTLKGYDKNQRGYGIDINKNIAAKKLTEGRPGKWLSEKEADDLMKEHIKYIYDAAQKHIQGFDTLPIQRKAALLGMLYRGDSVNKNKDIINIMEPDDTIFFNSISNYYKTKGLNERAKNSDNFFSKNKFIKQSYWNNIPQWNPPMQFKKGGMLELLKKGSSIHIKKENKGKFTDYCGGKVTSECIAKGKNSSDPAVRKRATFADNARKWKHKSGGKAFINGVNVLDSNPKAYKYVKKKYKMAQQGTKLQKIGSGIGKALNSDLGKTLINGIPSLISSNNAISGYGNTVKAQIDRDMADKRLEARQNSIQQADQIINNSFNPENPNSMGGDIVKGFITNNILNSNMAGLEQEAKNQKAQIDIENQQLKNQATSQFLGNIGNLATDYIASKALSKNGAPSDKMKQAYFNIKKFGIV